GWYISTKNSLFILIRIRIRRRRRRFAMSQMPEFGTSLLARGNGLRVHVRQGNSRCLRLRFALHERINAIGKQAYAVAFSKASLLARLHDLSTGIRWGRGGCRDSELPQLLIHLLLHAVCNVCSHVCVVLSRRSGGCLRMAAVRLGRWSLVPVLRLA